MKCPKCKKKLQTKRTLDDTTETKREKFCKKCKTTFETVEMFLEKLRDGMNALEKQKEVLRDNYDALYDRHSELKNAVNTVVEISKQK